MDCIVVYGFTGFIVEWFKSLDSGVSGPIYVNVDSPNLGFTDFNFLGGYQLKKLPVSESICQQSCEMLVP